ncbi:SRPBCC family protein [Mycolicibacterium sp. 3033]|nr:SRPBCC family protein [Mycolicibacterium aurantiacum]
MVVVHVERTIGAPPEPVFAWLADPENLRTAPLILRARWASGSPPAGVGAFREAVGVGMWFREEITAFNPPESYSYRIHRSFPVFVHQGGSITVEPVGEGVHVTWVTEYTHPRYCGGKALEGLSSRLLPWNFRAVLDRCADAVEA